MVERQQPAAGRNRRPKDEQFNERYLGLTREEVALRERMAQRFGRKA